MAVMVYELQVVGGPYDGTTGLAWADDGKTPPPDVIVLGRCPGDRSCGLGYGSRVRCKPPRSHTAYWTLDEPACPSNGTRYEKQDEHVERGEDGALTARAVYALGGLLEPANFGAAAREPLALAGGGR